MSQENVARYRVPPAVATSHRTLVQWLAVRLPRFARLYRLALFRLTPRSRLRRELLARAVGDGYEAWNRGDREAFLAVFDPEVELDLFGEVVGLDFENHYHGREGVLRLFATMDEAWESNRVEPQEVIDYGDRYLVLAHNRARGRGSGVELAHDIALFVTWSEGMVVHGKFYWSWG